MLKYKYVLICSSLVFLQACLVYSSCSVKTGLNDVISDNYNVYGYVQYNKCWLVLNPAKNIIYFHLKVLHLKTEPQINGNLTILLMDENKNYTFWSHSASGSITTSSTSVEIRFRVNSSRYPNNYKVNFTLQYDTDIVEDIRSKAIDWLKDQRAPLLDWRENTLKAMTALYLSGNATYDGTNLREELLVRRAEFLVSRALQRNTITEIDLSSYINFLRLTCDSPRHFASYDIIQNLWHRLETPGNFTHPIVYLALCNARENWPQRAISDLTNVLTSKSEYLFLKDIQAFAIMALSCQLNQTLTPSEKSKLLPIYTTSVANLKKKQLSDGSFGDIQESALAIQTLISTESYHSYSWNSRAAMKYITKQLNSSDLDFQSVYLSLPILNWKSLADISERNCTGNPRNNDDLIDDFTGTKIEVPNDRVRYSLFIGDKKDLIRTISLKIPDNFTAYQVMLLAEVRNIQFKFHWKRVTGKMYVQDISRIQNDPEEGKFWFLYLGSNSRKPLTPYFNKGPDEIPLKHGDHLVMWYKTVKI